MSSKKGKKNNKESTSLCNDTYLFEKTQTRYFGVNKISKFLSSSLCKNCPIEINDYTLNFKGKQLYQIISFLEKERCKEYPEEVIYFQRTENNLEEFVCAQSLLYSYNQIDYFGKKKELGSWIIQYGKHFYIGYSNYDLKDSLEKISIFFNDILFNDYEEELEDQQKIITEFKKSHNCYSPFTPDELKYKLRDIIDLNYIEINNLDNKTIIKVLNNEKIPNKLFLRTKENEEKFKTLQSYVETLFPINITQTNDKGQQYELADLKPMYGWIMQIDKKHFLLGLPNKTLKNVIPFVKNYVNRLNIINHLDIL